MANEYDVMVEEVWWSKYRVTANSPEQASEYAHRGIVGKRRVHTFDRDLTPNKMCHAILCERNDDAT